MAYPKLKQIITLKKQENIEIMQQLHAETLRKLTRQGQRLGPRNMQVVILEGDDAGLISIIESVNEELSMNMWVGGQPTMTDAPNRHTIQELESELNAAHKRVTPDTMYGIFPDWGESQLDKWAIECNSSYTFIFSLYYDPATMTTRQAIKLLGKPNIDLPTYIDKYSQAQTMHKLESNL